MSDRTLARYTDILRNDFLAFAQRAFLELEPAKTFESNWHIEVLAANLEAVRLGRKKRLIINVPPRTLKSFLGSIVFPAFALGHDPSLNILCTSYAQDVANDLALSCRTLMLSRFYQSLFGTRLSDDRQAVEEFKIKGGGARRAVSLSGSITGRGADIIIVDDPIKPDEAESESHRNRVNSSYQRTVSGRLNRDTGSVILLMQRLHNNDLAALVQKEEQWDVVAIPAIATRPEDYSLRTPYGTRTIHRAEGEVLQPQRQSASALNQFRKSQGARIFDAQYQQKPHGAEGATIARDWLLHYDDNSRPKEFDSVLQSWDTGIKGGESNSYTVCTTWGIHDHRFYLLDVYRARPDLRELKIAAANLARQYRPTVILVEDQSLGEPLMEHLDSLGLPYQPVPTGSASKQDRLYARSNKFESGQVLLPREATWLEDYVEELTTFPDCGFSDQVDSTTQALAWDASLGNASFANVLRTMDALTGATGYAGEEKKIKLRVLIGGGILQPGDGKPDIHVPAAGKIMELEYDYGASLANKQWTRFAIVPE